MLPREKIIKRGIHSLTYIDLISIIISNGIKGRDFKSISKEVFKKLKEVVSYNRELDISHINSIDGIGNIKAMQILCGIELGKRLYMKSEVDKPIIVNSEMLYQYLKNERKYKQERLVAIYLNARYEILDKRIVAIGGINKINVDIRDIISYALEYNACYVAIAHNHPSGDTTPSIQDITFTKDLYNALKLLNIDFLEHIVIGVDGWTRVDI